MATLGTLVVRVTADVKQAMGGLGAVEAKAKGTATALRGLGKVGGLALLGIGVAAIDAAMDFERAFATIRAGTGATGKALEGLKADFSIVFKGVPQDAETVSTAIADLNTRLGLTGKPLQRMAKQFLDLSRITKTEVAGNIRNVTRVFGDFSVATDKQKTSLDFLFRASQATGASVSDLAAKMVQYGAPLRQIGFDFEKSVAMMAKWEKEGVNVEAILGSLKIALGKFAKAGEAPAEAFKRVVEEIKKAPSAAEAATVALNAFGSRAMADAVGAIKEGRFEFSEFLATLRGGTETIARAGEAAKTTAEKIKEAWHGVKESLGAGMLEILRGLENLGKGWNEFIELIGDSQRELDIILKRTADISSRMSVGARKNWLEIQQAVGTSIEIIIDTLNRWKKAGIELTEKEKDFLKEHIAIANALIAKTQEEVKERIKASEAKIKMLNEVIIAERNSSKSVEWRFAILTKLNLSLIKEKGHLEKLKKRLDDVTPAMKTLADETERAGKAAGEAAVKYAGLAAVFGRARIEAAEAEEEIRGLWQTLKKTPEPIEDLILADLPDLEKGLRDTMEEAFVSGFESSLHSIGDLWKAFTIGMGDALAAALKQSLGSSFWASILGAVGGSLIGKAFSWIGGLFGGGGKSRAEKEMERRAAAEAAAAEAARKYAESLAAANQAIEDAVRQLQDLAIQIPTMAAGIVSGIISRRRMAREIRPLRRQLRRAFGTQVSWGFDPETEQDVERRTGLQKLLRQFGGKRDIIDIKEFRQLLAFAKQQGATPEQIRMLENLVEQLNQRALINIQIQNQKKLLREAEKERDLIKRNLPRMRELLREIERNTRRRGGGKGDGWRGDGDGDDDPLPPPKSQSSLEFMIDSGRSRFSRQSIRRL